MNSKHGRRIYTSLPSVGNRLWASAGVIVLTKPSPDRFCLAGATTASVLAPNISGLLDETSVLKGFPSYCPQNLLRTRLTYHLIADSAPSILLARTVRT